MTSGNGAEFLVRGVVDGAVVEASRSVGGRLVCTPALHRRAEVVVALGDTFESGADHPPVVATLSGDATAVALTCMRAMDRVTDLEFAFPR
jgi:hypothetical protein